MDSGYARLVLAVTEVRGPAHQVIAILEEARLDGEDFRSAWYKALRSLSPPRTSDDALKAAIEEDRATLAEIRPFLKAAYEGRSPTPAELSRARKRAERRLEDLAAA